MLFLKESGIAPMREERPESMKGENVLLSPPDITTNVRLFHPK